MLQSRVAEWALALAVLALGLGVAFFYLPHNHDSLWLIIGAERLLSGGVMPTDVYELNPPSVFVPYLLPAMIGGLEARTAYFIYVLEALAIITLCWRLMVPSLNKWWPQNWQAIGNVAVLAALVLGAGYGFGQRDHVGFILILPFLLWLAATAGQGRPINGYTLTMIFLAACGVVLKVHLVLPVALLLAAELITTRNIKLALQPALWAFGAIGLVLAATVLLAYPEWWGIAQDAMALYGGSNAPMDELLTGYMGRFGAALLVLVFLPKATSGSAFREAAPYLLFAAFGALLSGFVQGKGWTYHFLPFLMIFLPLTILVFTHLWQSARIMAAIVVVLALWGAQIPVRDYIGMAPFNRAESDLTQILNAKGTQQNVLALSTSVGAGIGSVVRAGHLWASRSSGQWLAPGLMQFEIDGADHALLETYRAKVFGDVVEDIARTHPDIIAVEVETLYPHRPEGGYYPFAAYYANMQVFMDALEGYDVIHDGPEWAVFERKAEGPATP